MSDFMNSQREVFQLQRRLEEIEAQSGDDLSDQFHDEAAALADELTAAEERLFVATQELNHRRS